MRTRSNTLAFSVRAQTAAVALSALALWYSLAVAVGPATAQTANDPPPPYPSAAAPTGDASALGQPSQSGQVPPPPPSPYSGGQSYGGQPYTGQGSPAPAPPSGPPAAEAPPGAYLNTYPEPGPYPAPYGPPPPDAVVRPGPVYVPAEPGAWVVPCWVFRLDETFVQRSTTRNQPLFYDSQQQTELLNSKTDLNFPVQTGFNLSALCHFPNGWEIEFGYFQLDEWIAKNFVPGDSLIVVGGAGSATEIVPSTDTGVQYESCLYLSEINLRRQLNKWLDLLIGFRGGELDERYTAFSDTVNFESRTTNSLYGFQVGADVKLLDNSSWHINGLCKLGVYGNAIDQQSSLDVIATALDQHGSQVAFMGEIGLSVAYDFGRHFSARAFYQAVWLSGVALAPEQIGGTNFNTDTVSINSNGSLFYQGGGIGLEVRY